MKHKLPNIIIVMADELRQQSVGMTKEEQVITPNIDFFSKNSLTLSHALSNCPICSPARAMLFTGKYPLSNGVIDNCYSKLIAHDVELRASERCLSDVLQEEGYSQGYIGKYHLDLPKVEDIQYTEGWRGDPKRGGTLWDAYTPLGERRHGFDFWYSYGCCDSHLSPHYWKNDALISERIDVDMWSVEHETNVAIDYIVNVDNDYRDSKKPFFLMVSFNPPHMPFDEVPDKYKELYKGQSAEKLLTRPGAKENKEALSSVANYFSAITGVDENFGRILNILEQEKIEDDTIVIFMSDHGELMGSHERMGKNSWQNEALLIPFILRWNGRVTPRVDNLIFNMPDLMPTILGLLGLSCKIPNDVEGVDYSSTFLGKATKRPRSGYYLTAQPFFHEERRGIKTHLYTFVVVINKKSQQITYVLHDDLVDKYQQENIASIEYEIVAKCKYELIIWLKHTNDPWLSNKKIMKELSVGHLQNFKFNIYRLLGIN